VFPHTYPQVCPSLQPPLSPLCCALFLIAPPLPLVLRAAADGAPSSLVLRCSSQIWRPARSRHCHTCGRCIDRYDHHCPAIRNCRRSAPLHPLVSSTRRLREGFFPRRPHVHQHREPLQLPWLAYAGFWAQCGASGALDVPPHTASPWCLPALPPTLPRLLTHSHFSLLCIPSLPLSSGSGLCRAAEPPHLCVCAAPLRRGGVCVRAVLPHLYVGEHPSLALCWALSCTALYCTARTAL